MVKRQLASKGLLTTLTLLWLSPSTFAQTCPSYHVGESIFLGSLAFRQTPNRNTVYINTLSMESARCGGMVYGWRLCTHPITAPASVQVSMYRKVGSSYHLVNGSVYELTLQSSISSYTCLNRFLDESDYFSVEQGDMVAACWHDDGSSRVENFRSVFISLVSGGSCSQAVISDPSQTPRRRISLSAYINVDECELGEAVCHDNTACSDVVGGEDSYNCTCNPGFTGDGFSMCVDINECTMEENKCHESAMCSNIAGSYDCICNPGFTGDGFSCVSNSGEMGGDGESGTSQTETPGSNGGGGRDPLLTESSSGGEGGDGGVVVAAVALSLLLVVGALAVVAGLVGFVLYRRKKLGQQQLTPHTVHSIDNEMCGKHYETVPDYNHATLYEVPQESLRKDGHFSTLQIPPELVYEPTSGTHMYATLDPNAGNIESSFNYEVPGDIYEQTVTSENIYESASLYQCPSKDEAGLYEQISSYDINVIRRRDIKIISHLGSGQFGSVNKAVWTNGRRQTTVAVKILTDSGNTVKGLQEAAIMAQFKHPNILTLHGVVSTGDPKMIVVELMNNGDLKKNVTRMRPDPGQLVADSVPYQLLDFSKQVALGLHYLSCRGFVHRDLAARNILVSNMTCKIAGFGLSRGLADTDIYVSHGGMIPVRWTAPEALWKKKYSTASDVWSYGCVLYEIWSLGHKPFETTDTRTILQLVSTGYRLPPPPGCPKKIYKLMIDTWHPDASSRPQPRDVLKGLLGNVDEVLAIPPEDVPADSQAAVQGAPLDKATHLYQDLQNTYTV